MSRNPRSTVGTVTEIYDHLRLLFAGIGIPHCPNGHAIERQSVQQIVDQVLALPEGTLARPRAAHQAGRKTEGDRIVDGARRQGLRPCPRRRGAVRHRRRAQARQVQAPFDIEVVVDRYVVRHAEAPEDAERADDGRSDRPRDRSGHPPIRRPRLADSIETALRLGEGVVLIAPAPRDDEPPAFDELRLQREVQLPV